MAISTMDKINKDRDHFEALFVACLWKNIDLYSEYDNLLKQKKSMLSSQEAAFYYRLGMQMFKAGYEVMDMPSVDTFLIDHGDQRKWYEDHGGYSPMADLMSLVDPRNVEAYYDQIVKKNTLESLFKSYTDVFKNVEQFDDKPSDSVYDVFEAINNGVSLAVNAGSKIEDLVIDSQMIDIWDSGDAVGLDYGKICRLLNSSTLGLPLGELCLFAASSGTGKTSFIFNNMIIPISQGEAHPMVCVISNEMRSDAYKLLLMEYILTNDMNEFHITRRDIKRGGFSPEVKKKLEEAARISEQKYSNIKFVKLFDNDTSKIIKYVRRLSAQGCQLFLWDTMKSDDIMDETMWQQLLVNSRRIFNAVSKANVAMICTYQLALHTLNQRFLDAGCLSNSKQIKEVVSELFMMRKLWDDEYTDQKFDCQAIKWVKDPSGKYKKEVIELKKDKQYYVVFLDKTRNDEDKKTFLYEWNPGLNYWKEVGYCTIVNNHVSGG